MIPNRHGHPLGQKGFDMSRNIVASKPMPICILSGFLGAGKTTLLNNLISGDHGLRMGVLVNDFGVIDIDSQLVERIDENTISLSNGCICCSIREDFLRAVLGLVKRENPPEYLLIETSGVSDPSAVAFTLMNPALTRILRVETVVTVVDAAEFLSLTDEQYRLAEAQINTADMIVVNKVDLVAEERLTAVNDTVRSLAPNARILHAKHGQVSLPLILGLERTEKRVRQLLDAKDRLSIRSAAKSEPFRIRPHHRGPKHDHHPEHHHCSKDCEGKDSCCEHGAHPAVHQESLSDDFQSISYTCDKPLDLNKVRQVLMDLPTAIFRLKGFFYVDAALDKRLLIQVVGSRISAAQVEPWGDRSPRTEVVAIGKRGEMDERVLAAQFSSCITKDKTSLKTGLAEKVMFWRRREKDPIGDGQSGRTL